jgi:hypothetical protein
MQVSWGCAMWCAMTALDSFVKCQLWAVYKHLLVCGGLRQLPVHRMKHAVDGWRCLLLAQGRTTSDMSLGPSGACSIAI